MSALGEPRMRVSCTACGTDFRLKTDLAGIRVKCPKCGDSFRVPDAPPEAASSSKVAAHPSADLVRFACSQCAAPLKAPATAA